jgi:hypothetical protein
VRIMGKESKGKSEKEIEKEMRKRLKETSETVLNLGNGANPDLAWLNPKIQAYTTYINFKSQERTLTQIRITAIATVALAIATLILAGVTAFR